MEIAERLMSVRSHALDRYREHYPGATKRDVLQAATYGVDVTIPMGRTLAGRPVDYPGCDNLDWYILSPSRRGMFVARRDTGDIRTYLRFGISQQQFVLEHWPTGEPLKEDLEPQLVPVPQHTGTRESLEKLHYPVLGVPLPELAISRALRLSLGFDKAFYVQTAFARALLEHEQLYGRGPLQAGEEICLTLEERHGLRPKTRAVPVSLAIRHGVMHLQAVEPGESPTLRGVELPVCGHELRKLIGE